MKALLNSRFKINRSCVLLIFTPIIFFSLFPLTWGQQHFEAFYGFSILALLLAYDISKKITLFGGLALLWPLISGLFLYYFSDQFIPQFGPYGTYQICASILSALVGLVLWSSFLILCSKENFKHILLFLKLGALLDALIIICHPARPYALLGNHGMDAMYIAMMMPFLPSVLFLTPFLALLILKSSTGYLALGFYCLLVLLQYRREAWAKFILVWGSIIPIALYIMLMPPIHIHINDNGRIFNWRLATQTVGEIHPWIGLGTGTYEVFGPFIRNSHFLKEGGHVGQTLDIFLWLHNDWLQVLFENGTIGFMLTVIFYFVLLFKAYKANVKLLQSLLLYGLCACFQMPIHIFITQLVGITLVGLIIDSEGARSL